MNAQEALEHLEERTECHDPDDECQECRQAVAVLRAVVEERDALKAEVKELRKGCKECFWVKERDKAEADLLAARNEIERLTKAIETALALKMAAAKGDAK